MKYFSGFVLLLLAALGAGCSPPSPKTMLARAASAEEAARAKADTVRDAVRRSAMFGEALEMYGGLREKYPDSPEAEQALFKIATIHNNDTRRFPEAVALYKEYADRYPDEEKAAVATFLIGYIYHNELGMLDSAESAYRTFLSRYPDHELAVSAQFELNSLGKSPEEILPPEKEPGPQAASRRGTREL
jgi:TolA-binding protein